MTASPVHCHYCFDVLSSKLARQQPLELSEIESLYAKQQLHLQAASHGSAQTNGSTTTTDSLALSSTVNEAPLLPNGNATQNGTYASVANTPYPKTPLFVTWKIKSKSGRMDLRGCIGTFEAKPLDAGLRDYAITAGLHDSRFDPITTKELPRLECGVTLLHDFEPAADVMDWELGKHGLQIDFVYHHRRMGATYLPDVPVEQRWTKEETLTSLMRKAGWTGRSSEWKKIPIRLTRYQGSKATVKWDEYKELVDGDWYNAAEQEDGEGGKYREKPLQNGHA